MDDLTREILHVGIGCAKTGDVAEARRNLERVTRMTRDEDALIDAWYWLFKISTDVKEKRALLDNILAHNAVEPRARRELAILDGKLKPDQIIDPNQIKPAASGSVQSADVDRFTCPQCGGRMLFSPDGQMLVCESCQSESAIQNGEEVDDQDFIIAMATMQGHSQPVDMHAFHCEGCGVEFLLPPESITATCSFCGSNYVVSVGEMRATIPPEAVIPFAFNQREVFQRWVDWFRSVKVKPSLRPEAPRGVYLPVWTFDIFGEAPWMAQVEIREDEWVTKRGATSANFRELCVSASKRKVKFLKDALQQFDLGALQPYDPRYLADWPAEIYQVSMAQASLEARGDAAHLAQKQALDEARRSFDHPVRNVAASSARLMANSFKLILVPVWLASYQFEEETFAVLINGQTGAVHADKPAFDFMDWLDDLDRRIFGD
jgi:hypothetical protein